MKLPLVFWVICLCVPSCAFSQPEILSLRTWDQHSGLPANKCLSAIQDQSGYIWIATVNGICKFNGNTFREVGRYDKSIAVQGEVRDIIQDNSGVFWLASFDQGLVKLDLSEPGEKQVRVFNYSGLDKSFAPPPHSLNKLLDDGRGFIWVGTEASGLFRFNKSTEKFEQWPLTNPTCGFNKSIRCLYKKEDGIIWIGMVNGLVEIDISKKTTEYFNTSYLANDHRCPPTVRGIARWTKDSFALATDRGAYMLSLSDKVLKRVYLPEDSITLKAVEYNDVIKKGNQLWFATIDRGIWIANLHKNRFSYSWQTKELNKSIGKIPVHRFLRDRNNNIWICHSMGLSYYNSSQQRFINKAFAFNIAQPPKKNFIIGTENGVAVVRPDSFFRWDFGNSFPSGTRLSQSDKSGGATRIWRYFSTGYIVQNQYGVFTCGLKGESLKNVFKNTVLPLALDNPDNISQILVDTINGREKWLILVNEKEIAFEFNPASGNLRSFPAVITDLTLKSINRYYTNATKSPSGGVWISTRDAGLLYKPMPESDSIVQYGPGSESGKRIPGSYVEDIAFDAKGKLWATIRGVGLVEIQIHADQEISYQIYGKANGLTYLNLSQIQIDNYGNIWISSSNGLFRFDQKKKWFTYYGQSTGIYNPVLTFASAKDSNGRIYFAGHDYLLSLQPADFLNETPAASLQLLSISANDKVIDIANKEQIRLSSEEKTLTFVFDVLDFQQPAGHYVQCKLEGYDTGWSLLQDVFQQTYKDLPGGNYTFNLRKFNGDAGDHELIQFGIVIQKQLHETWPFRILIGAIIMGLSYLFTLLYTRRKLKVQRKELERKRLVDLERLRISAELHDDIGGELSAIRMLSEMVHSVSSGQSRERLSTISAFSVEVSQKLNEIVWALNNKNDTLDGLVLYINRFVSKRFEELAIGIDIKYPPAFPAIEIDGITRRNIFLLVKEAINNIIKHSSATFVTLEITIDSRLNICISDNGIGIDPDIIYDDLRNGMKTMKKRIQDVNGLMKISNSSGTAVTFIIPF